MLGKAMGVYFAPEGGQNGKEVRNNGILKIKNLHTSFTRRNWTKNEQKVQKPMANSTCTMMKFVCEEKTNQINIKVVDPQKFDLRQK